MARLELAQLSPPPPQDGVSTNSTTSALEKINLSVCLPGLGRQAAAQAAKPAIHLPLAPLRLSAAVRLPGEPDCPPPQTRPGHQAGSSGPPAGYPDRQAPGWYKRTSPRGLPWTVTGNSPSPVRQTQFRMHRIQRPRLHQRPCRAG